MTSQPPNAAWEQASAKLAELHPLKELASEVRLYPVRLLIQLVEQADRRQGPVPDHVLTLLPYLGETALRALVDGGYVTKRNDVSYAIAAYEPTDTGRAIVASLNGPSAPRQRRRG